jgi:para-nitrobenzyl esterase
MKILGVLLIAGAALAQTGPTVAVTGGEIRGIALKAGAAFKGVPFAAAPVGDLRWKAPAAVKPWSGVKDATAMGPACFQPTLNWNKSSTAHQSEDCLYLNVWTPEWPAKAGKPVMMWIHGGGNMAGSAVGLGGIEPPFDGEVLAGHGVVVVTVQYRLGLLGFLSHPELTAESGHHASGNYAIMDLVAALQWVKANAAKFGGDPNNVTIFGQSAGGNNVGQLLVSPLSNGLFARAIEESGTVVGSARVTPPLADAEKDGVEFAKKMGAPDKGALAYMRKLSVDDVLKASPEYGVGAIGPVADGYVIPEVSAKTFAAGKEKKVPILMGSQARERSLPGGAEALNKELNSFYGPMAAKAAPIYAQPSSYAPYGDAGAQLATDTMNRCPTIAIENFHSVAGNTVYAYEFSHAFPTARNGASHSGELRYLFGNFPAGDVAETERKISNEMQMYWTNYARNGDPNGNGLPVWPKYDPKARRYLEFTDNGPVPKENLRDAACGLFAEYVKEKLSR